ncbi:hypothetical protein P3T73_08070 [Kiritimatiellota bacterium B12222]|nr:hypothetical protein P3T73_08070 [Kiritimatiellota bacterium B12222]
MNVKVFTFLSLLMLVGLDSMASQVTFNTPTLDRWMYPFNGTPGSRSSGLTFGAQGNPGFDERDAQFIVGYDTSTQISANQGAANYQINSATLTLQHNGSDFIYDPTYDSYTTYLDSGATGYQADADAGRPMELFGLGYRNGESASTFTETSAFSPPGAPASSVRNAYALGYNGGSAVDVSNNLDYAHDGASGFDPILFGLGQAIGLSAGDTISAGQDIQFSLNLSSPEVLAYLQESLNRGILNLAATSLHSASQGGPSVYPSFDTKENIVGQAGILGLDVTIIPEPSMFFLWGMGGFLLLRLWKSQKHVK